MSDKKWYYSVANQKVGPVSQSDIQDALDKGTIALTDLVWSEGMPQWVTASVAFSPASPPTLPSTTLEEPIAPVHAITMGDSTSTAPVAHYFHPRLGMPQRAIETLKKHAIPEGDTNVWPLGDEQLMQFHEAYKLRKKIMSAANLFKGLMALSLIGLVILLFGFGIMAATSKAGTLAGPLLGGAVVLGMLGGLTILYFFTWKATAQSRRWGPLTMAILFTVSGVLSFVSSVIGVMNSTRMTQGPEVFGGMVSGLLTLVFAWVAFRGYRAIGPYLRCPAWCHEILIKTLL